MQGIVDSVFKFTDYMIDVERKYSMNFLLKMAAEQPNFIEKPVEAAREIAADLLKRCQRLSSHADNIVDRPRIGAELAMIFGGFLEGLERLMSIGVAGIIAFQHDPAKSQMADDTLSKIFNFTDNLVRGLLEAKDTIRECKTEFAVYWDTFTEYISSMTKHMKVDAEIQRKCYRPSAVTA
jgi:hypothetical protein